MNSSTLTSFGFIKTTYSFFITIKIMLYNMLDNFKDYNFQDIPNVSLTDRYAEPSDDGKFYSVSSSSFASSDNDNGKLSGFRQAETVVNDNGKITKYRVHS